MSAHLVSPELVGRSAEIGHLAGALANAPATVLVGGEAGVGKSRLVNDFTAGLDATVLLGGCVELDGLPFAPFVAALRGIPVTDRERVDLAPLLPAFGAQAAGDEARPRLFEGVLSLLARLSDQRPVVLVVEDAHWLDRSSRDLLDFLVRNQRAVPRSLVVVTYRSDELGGPVRPLLAELSRVPWVRRIELPRLSARDVRAQLRGILGAEPDPVTARDVFRRSEGNPLFVEALVDGGAELSLEELLLSRVERLAADAVALVRAAAVGGRRISHDLLAKVHDVSPIRSIVDAGILVVDGDGYAFRHALIRDAVYQRLLPGERVELHARYAAVLPRSVAAELAHHRYAAGDIPGAVSAAWEAAGAARRALAYAEQLAMLERVLSLWDNASHLEVDRLTVLEAAGEAASRAGEHERGEELTTELLADLDPATECIRYAAVLEQRGRLRAQLGRPGALEDHREAVRLVPVGHPIRGYLLNSLAARLMQIPLPDEAREVAEEALGASHHAGDDPSEAAALITLAVLDARLGDLDAQLPRLRHARAIAENVAAHRVRLRALHCEASLSEAYGRLEEAEELARLGIRTARELGLARSAGASHAVDLTRTLIGAGRWDEALECVDHALDHAPPAVYHAHLLCLAGFVDVRRGEVDRAEWALTRARELADVPFAQNPLQLPGLEAEVRLAQGRLDEVAAVVRAALDLPNALVASRFAWPLVALGVRAGLPVPDMPVAGPVQAAWALTCRGEWPEAVAAWEALGQPLWHAEALFGLASVTRDPAAMRKAAELADGLGAAPLRDRIADLARRARVTLTGDGPAERARFGLTAREVEILRLVTDGLANREIAERLFISAKTASVHVSNILGKLGVANRVEAAATAHKLRLFE
ncbi:DNA-binding CsgD family transcriptional regulator/tetratricopeptide (TPR) repeat protein [Saccharothrix ecbatanensis]|uniref:DNA-binding CsgD family transcriptional regulator/tetratricopeptide (TPR) repeat protein n=1 Tax=Saccharothrix ecbatanensis TaxID=1105145 RepID=A0A7W9M5Y4_9PSEU|nr:helix-turn-helix transcriptional regulator [Saccharothrix ecbatanensis]MBB5808573.1 DNA-binding CsgD family transcriptional regulator/tetratricopeptide (TPR) repeat protein [Saccharothrix ecbatanensis]